MLVIFYQVVFMTVLAPRTTTYKVQVYQHWQPHQCAGYTTDDAIDHVQG